MRTLALAGIFLLFQTVCFAQSLTDLQQKKQSAEQEIDYTTRLLDQARQEEKASLNRLQLINNTISQRNVLISSLSEELSVYQEFIDNNSMAVRMFSDDIEEIKKEYAALIRLAYKNKNAMNEMMFLLSADNFNQAYRRLIYMRRYTSYRKKQAETIQAIQSLLNEKIKELEELRDTRRRLIEETREETVKLALEQTRQNAEIKELKQQQQDLRRKLVQQRQIEQQLEREIQRMIEEQARGTTDTGEPAFELTPEQRLTGTNFEQNKRRLPWPVERGVITERFGIHQHPVLSNVQVRNNGINIATEIGAEVRAVFDGEVSRVFGITGGNTAVIIRHGKYLSVYSNLREVTVKKGDKVKAKQTIGTVYSDFDEAGKSILKFQIWRENQKMNPEEWIGR
jgi:septal ring factor EnvC (AmiA/AmiB activator)